MSANPKRGAIRSIEAYAQGKMLDHSAWREILPRNITPSDIDACFDNSGDILYCELTRHATTWLGDDGKVHPKIGYGQFMLYFNAIGPISKDLAVLLHHDVPATRAIDTRADIDAFQVMVRKGDEVVFSPVWHRWEKFVVSWYDNPSKVRRICVDEAAKAAFETPGEHDEWLAGYEAAFREIYGYEPW